MGSQSYIGEKDHSKPVSEAVLFPMIPIMTGHGLVELQCDNSPVISVDLLALGLDVWHATHTVAKALLDTRQESQLQTPENRLSVIRFLLHLS